MRKRARPDPVTSLRRSDGPSLAQLRGVHNHATRTLVLFALVTSVSFARPVPLVAQSRGETAQAPAGTASSFSTSSSTSAPQPAQDGTDDDDDDAVLDPAEPDFVLINLPTNMRLPVHSGNFRLTHRFAGNLRSGSFSEQAGNLFGIDQGAIIGFEYRNAVYRHVQAAVYRTNFDKTIQIYGKYDALRQGDALPVSISAVASVEGADNFQERYAPAVGLVISRKAFRRFAAYVVPMWVNNTAASLAVTHDHGQEGGAEEDHDHPDVPTQSTFFLGLGGRARLTSTVYVSAEISPRLSGYQPGQAEYGFGIEKRVGAHSFALTFTNTFSSTFAQLARGGTANTLYLGFNLGRKFY